MDGLELAIRFSYIVNALRYCGPEEAQNKFLHYLKTRDNPDAVKSSLKRFAGLFPYLSAIAKKHSKQPFDNEVAEAYWIGNSLLDSFTNEDIKNIIRQLMNRGLPSSLGDTLISRLPSGLVPHHNFNVFYVGVGNITASIDPSLKNMDLCRISWGKVTDIQNNLLVVKTSPVERSDKLLLGSELSRTATFLPEMLPTVKKGDTVALHWGFAALVLNDSQLHALKKYTETILQVINSSPADKA